MRTIGLAERRARLGIRHHLAARTPQVETAVDGIVGFHASDPVTVYLSAFSRVDGFAVTDLQDALDVRRTLLRVLGMRRTLFVVPRGTAPVVDAACTKAFVDPQRRRLVAAIEDQKLADGDADAWLREVCEQTYAALVARGAATARELKAEVPELGRTLSFGEGRSWATTVGLSTRVLFLLATEARIVRVRPLGTWVSGQYRWAPMSSWLGEEPTSLDPGEARATLATRWLRAFGPATATDLRWWTGWGARTTATALADAAAVEVDLDGTPGWTARDDLDPVPEAPPWVALLPSLDPTVMGWKERTWFLGDHAPLLFDRNGNAGPTVWCDGRVVGGWAARPSGEIAVRLLDDVGRERADAIDAEAARLAAWLGDVRITPRFRTPLERDLLA